jgi:hypothetical protein
MIVGCPQYHLIHYYKASPMLVNASLLWSLSCRFCCQHLQVAVFARCHCGITTARLITIYTPYPQNYTALCLYPTTRPLSRGPCRGTVHHKLKEQERRKPLDPDTPNGYLFTTCFPGKTHSCITAPLFLRHAAGLRENYLRKGLYIYTFTS